ncbi:MAG: glycoside hydrolase family 127 protein [Candidatus Aminicenantales bacterium]
MNKKLCLSLAVVLVLGLLIPGCSGRAGKGKDYPVQPVSFADVEIADAFWAPRQETNRTVTIPYVLAISKGSPWSPFLEGAAATLVRHPDPELQKTIAKCLDETYEYVMHKTPTLKWKQLLNGELLSAGHFFEAAIQFSRSTGDRKSLDQAIRIADDIDGIFGPGKRHDVSNHEAVKMGLIRLYRATGNVKYLNLARFFLDMRGRADGRELFGEYAQDHQPVVDQKEAVGHAVRAVYLYSPLTDIAALTGEESYLRADDAIWEDAVNRKSYITGSIASHRDEEDFGKPYELPNVSAWNETCAANGNILWNHRMFLLHRDGKYIDHLERILYNGFLAGVSLSGDRFLYQNPLKTYGGFTRQPEFGPNCCPPNVVRRMALVGDYVYATAGNDIYVNLYIAGSGRIRTDAGPVTVRQETGYPWDGAVKIAVEPEKPAKFTLLVRIPGWARNEAWPGALYRFQDTDSSRTSLEVNGEPVAALPDKGYVRIEREWKQGDVVELDLPMPVRRVLSDERIEDNRGLMALERGPLVYCAEGIDNEGNVSNLLIPDDAALSARFEPALLNGVAVIAGEARAMVPGKDGVSVEERRREFKAIPYYAWGNRADGEMSVWLARDPGRAKRPPVPTIASTSRVSSSCGDGSVDANYPGGKAPTIAARFYPRAQSGSSGPEALFDEVEPTGSADGSGTFFRLRPQSGDTAWVQYDFRKPADVSSTEVYWKDDGELCILPKAWEVQYRKDGQWVPVTPAGSYSVERDKFNRIEFDKVRTDGLRLSVKLNGQLFKKGPRLGPPDGNYMDEDVTWFEGGVIEWKVGE